MVKVSKASIPKDGPNVSRSPFSLKGLATSISSNSLSRDILRSGNELLLITMLYSVVISIEDITTNLKIPSRTPRDHRNGTITIPPMVHQRLYEQQQGVRLNQPN